MKLLVSGLLCLFFALPAGAAKSESSEARVTKIIRDVRLLPNEADARPAAVNDRVDEETGVRTGDQSRSELTFADLTITRLGANSVFSFNKAGRSVDLGGGSILLRVPKDSGGASIRAPAVSVAVTGTTLILETQRAGRSKLIVLEGGARCGLIKYPAQRRNVLAGQMLDVPAGATTLPEPINIDLNQLMKTHPLIVGFPPLPSQGLIATAAKREPVYQGQQVGGGGGRPTGGVGLGGFNVPGLFGGGRNNPPGNVPGSTNPQTPPGRGGTSTNPNVAGTAPVKTSGAAKKAVTQPTPPPIR